MQFDDFASIIWRFLISVWVINRTEHTTQPLIMLIRLIQFQILSFKSMAREKKKSDRHESTLNAIGFVRFEYINLMWKSRLSANSVKIMHLIYAQPNHHHLDFVNLIETRCVHLFDVYFIELNAQCALIRIPRMATIIVWLLLFTTSLTRSSAWDWFCWNGNRFACHCFSLSFTVQAWVCVNRTTKVWNNMYSRLFISLFFFLALSQLLCALWTSQQKQQHRKTNGIAIEWWCKFLFFLRLQTITIYFYVLK